eukprot:jgi/Botrbrau1/10222/Bobra.0362s0012.1
MRSANIPNSRCLLDLPEDLLTTICKLLDVDTFKAARLACKAMKTAGNAHISRLVYKTYTSQECLESLLHSLPSLSEIVLDFNWLFELQLLNANGVGTALHTLKISMARPSPAQWEHIMSLVMQVPKLHTLILTSAYLPHLVRLDHVMSSCSSLRHLALNLSWVTIRDLEALLAPTQLITLRVESWGIQDNLEEGLAEVFGEGLSKLTALAELRMVPTMFRGNLTCLTKLRKLWTCASWMRASRLSNSSARLSRPSLGCKSLS